MFGPLTHMELLCGKKFVTNSLHPCVFFDRDGIVNPCPGEGYVEKPEDFSIQPEFITSLRIVKKSGFMAVIITNQRGVGKGVYSDETLQKIHNKMTDELGEVGLFLDGVYACTTADPDSPLRKPKPGLILAAVEDLKIDIHKSWMVGDRETDVQAGQAAGCRTVLVTKNPQQTVADVVCKGVEQLALLLPALLSEK